MGSTPRGRGWACDHVSVGALGPTARKGPGRASQLFLRPRAHGARGCGSRPLPLVSNTDDDLLAQHPPINHERGLGVDALVRPHGRCRGRVQQMHSPRMELDDLARLGARSPLRGCTFRDDE
eukprot:6999261-Prymnesium_polylepis.2